MSSERARGFLFAGGYLAIYAACLLVLVRVENFSLEEPLFLLVVVGGGFSLLAWLLTRNVRPLPADTPGTTGILIYLLPLAAFVTWGFQHFPSEQPAQDILKTMAKLAIFVAIPMLLFRTRLRLSWSRRDTIVAVVMAAVLIALQMLVGSGPKRIAELHLPALQLVVAAIGALLWMSLEAGLVEEYFFRASLQTRLERATQSPVGGIVITALLFGLIHSPGLYLRSGMTHEALGAHPSLLMAIGYSIVILSPAGLFFGILWARTRNLLLVVLIHGAGDLIPNLADFARNFHIG